MLLTPSRVQQQAVSAEWNLALASVLVVALLQQAVTARRARAATTLSPTKHQQSQSGLAPRNRTAANRNTSLASSRNRARRPAQGSRRSRHSETETSGQKSIPSRQCPEPTPSRHYGASPYRNPFRAGSDQSGKGRRSIDARWSLRGERRRKTRRADCRPLFLRAAPTSSIFRR